MKKLYFALLLLLLVGLAPAAWAAPGDTTRVTIFSNRHITHHGNFDTTAVLPAAGRYRKIRLHYVLGRYACAPGSQYCGSWDYTTQVLVLPPAHDTLEIARVITPYASDWLSLNKSHDYVIDVTDYAAVLRGTRTMRYRYDGYSWGFSLTMYLEFIEGTPARDALDATNVYAGYFDYGNPSNPLESHLTDRAVTPAAGAASSMLKSTVTGHGADAGNCAEFCNFTYNLLVDGNLAEQHALWRNDCGRNQVYPQTGTWVYNRANWCPGNAVVPIYDNLGAPPASGSPATHVNIDMPAYTANTAGGGSQPAYYWHSQLISYSAPNFAVDAELVDIIAPTNNENYFRENPACDAARVLLRNSGGTTLTAATFQYRVDQGAWQTYAWTGALDFGQQVEVSLPYAGGLVSSRALGTFEVNVLTANGQPDPNALNNTLRSKFVSPVVLPAGGVISLTTNNTTENAWYLYDAQNQVVAYRIGAVRNTTYNDVQNLPVGCYRLVVSDTGCNGLSWWNAASAGTGSFRLLNAQNQVIRTYNPDFGCQLVVRFRVAQPQATRPGLPESQLAIYPNPSNTGLFQLDWKLSGSAQNVAVRVLDVTGRVVHTQTLPNVRTTVTPLDLRQLPQGIYTLEGTTTEGVAHRTLVIQ